MDVHSAGKYSAEMAEEANIWGRQRREDEFCPCGAVRDGETEYALRASCKTRIGVDDDLQAEYDSRESDDAIGHHGGVDLETVEEEGNKDVQSGAHGTEKGYKEGEC